MRRSIRRSKLTWTEVRHPHTTSRCLLCHHRHWTAVVSRGWAKVATCRLHVALYCTVLCQIVSLQYLSRSSLYRLAYFLVIWCPRGDTRGPLVVFEAVDVSFPGQFYCCSHIADYICAFCPLSLTQMLTFLSLYIMLSILLSILVRSVLCLFCEYPGLYTMSKLATHRSCTNVSSCRWQCCF